MKSNKLIYPLLIALAAVSLASTGCKHQPMRVTNLPSQTGPITDNQNQPPSIPSTPPISPDDKGPGTTAMTDLDLSKYNQDPAALAANTVHFPFDSSTIKSSEQANVAAVASALSSVPTDCLLIEGHCDERGTEEYNRALGERRADALREALAKLSIDANRIKTISYGKDKPEDPGHNAAAWTKNRRGVFILLHPKTGGAGAPTM